MNSRIKLIKNYFDLSGGTAIREIKALSDKSKMELGSAIARYLYIKEEDCDFTFVAY